jgi:phosphoglycolate phosphatase-like HAD superfamily hydrolase
LTETPITRIKSVMFDFAGTLCSERYFVPLGREVLEVIGQLLFDPGNPQLVNAWMVGERSSQDIAAFLSEHLPFSESVIMAALRRGCANLSFNPAVHDFARSLQQVGIKTALVTANMDVFSEVVVPAHHLEADFDVILNTADQRTLDKSRLWRKAFESFGPDYTFCNALLVEDSQDMTQLFEALGGWAYTYQGDHAFLTWLREKSFSLRTQRLCVR